MCPAGEGGAVVASSVCCKGNRQQRADLGWRVAGSVHMRPLPGWSRRPRLLSSSLHKKSVSMAGWQAAATGKSGGTAAAHLELHNVVVAAGAQNGDLPPKVLGGHVVLHGHEGEARAGGRLGEVGGGAHATSLTMVAAQRWRWRWRLRPPAVGCDARWHSWRVCHSLHGGVRQPK